MAGAETGKQLLETEGVVADETKHIDRLKHILLCENVWIVSVIHFSCVSECFIPFPPFLASGSKIKPATSSNTLHWFVQFLQFSDF